MTIRNAVQPSAEQTSLILTASAPHRCDVELYLPISARMLNYILKDLPIRWETATRTIMAVHQIGSLEKITLVPGAYITQDPETLDLGLYYRHQRNGPGLQLELNIGMTADGGTRETLEAIFEMMMMPGRAPLVEPVQHIQPGLSHGQQWELSISGCSLEAYHLILELVSSTKSASVTEAEHDIASQADPMRLRRKSEHRYPPRCALARHLCPSRNPFRTRYTCVFRPLANIDA